MNLKPIIPALLILFLLGACVRQPGMILSRNFKIDGKYQFYETPGRKAIRYFNRKYWGLAIYGNKGTLSFDDDHGIESFKMTVNITNQDDRVILSMDSLIWTGYAVGKFPALKHGDPLMALIFKDDCLCSNLDNYNSFFSNIDFIQKRQAKFEKIPPSSSF